MTTLNNPARSINDVIADLKETIGQIETDRTGIHTVWATYSVAHDWMVDEDGEPSTEWNWILNVSALPLGEPQVNNANEAVYALAFEYSYNYADWQDRSGDYDDVDR